MLTKGGSQVVLGCTLPNSELLLGASSHYSPSPLAVLPASKSLSLTRLPLVLLSLKLTFNNYMVRTSATLSPHLKLTPPPSINHRNVSTF